MEQQKIHLTEAEWKVMEFLWEKSPRTGRQATDWMAENMEWNRSTTLTLLRRLEEKGAVTIGRRNGVKQFKPALSRKAAAIQVTQSFLSRIYNNSISELVEMLISEQSIPSHEQAELRRILSCTENNQATQ